ncbi:MAG: DUF4337 domain-containing protein [Acidobacteriota bacterium]|nr:DUF4337 domain-containing protein [Acidobacteriota bacterium]
MPEELKELHDSAEEGAHQRSLAPVTVTMAILAVLVAAVGLMSHRSHTEEVLNQNRATDQWTYYQAKEIRLRSYELFLDQLSVFTVQGGTDAAAVKEKYANEVQRYRGEQQKIEEQARDYEKEVAIEARRANRFDLGEVMLEAALVICSITLLTKKRCFWISGTVLGLVGVAVGVAGFFVA